MKAADLDDVAVLATVPDRDGWDRGDVMWTNTAAVAEHFPDAPFKVVAAKLSKLLKRGLVTGCDCGCRGDWVRTEWGDALVREAQGE